jgi:antitoxin component YwqK of YwqJK toxin-antitoxin module
MNVRVLLLIILTIGVGVKGITQDTIRYNWLWKPVSSDKYTYYRLYSVQDSVIEVKDYFRSGELQMTGYYALPDSNIPLYDYFFNELEDGHRRGDFHWYKQNGNRDFSMFYDPLNSSGEGAKDSLIHLSYADSLHNQLVYAVYYSKKGIKASEGYWFKNFREHGVWVFYYNDGSVYKTISYDLGKLHGFNNTYYSDGDPIISVPYHQGKKHGSQISYDYYGEPKTIKKYVHGKLISKKKIQPETEVEIPDVPLNFR